jgi:hypothetical protein
MVKMGTVEVTCFAFSTGLTFCGLAGSMMELAAGRRLSFTDPFVSPRHMPRSLGAAAAAGPFMLANDALDAWRSRGVSMLTLVSCVLTAAGWALATGVVVIDLASRAAELLS